jgi:iron complex transport system permease protein
MQSINPRLVLVIFTALSILSIVFALLVGSVDISAKDVVYILSGGDNPHRDLIMQLRLPRALAAWITGALLALSGCLMQVLLRNPLADPYILGVSGGAACAALLGISLGLAASLIPVAAFTGALASVLLVFGISRGTGAWSSTRLLLTGVVIAAGWGAIISLILALSPDNSLRSMLFWLMGDLSLANIPIWAPLIFVVVLFTAMLRARSLNVLAIGETTARLLGEDTKKLVWLVYLMASLLTAAAVSIAGSVGFIGLIIPHAVRLLVGPDHRVLIPAASLFGGTFLVLADTAARTVLAPQQLPVGVITALIGVPMFLFLLHKAKVIR